MCLSNAYFSIQPITAVKFSFFIKLVNTKADLGACAEHLRSITLKSAPANGAKSVLLITNKSERVIPDRLARNFPLALRQSQKSSAKSRLKVADKLSAAGFNKIISTSGKRATISSAASKFIDASSRDQRCVDNRQVSTPIMRSAGNRLFWLKTPHLLEYKYRW